MFDMYLADIELLRDGDTVITAVSIYLNAKATRWVVHAFNDFVFRKISLGR